MIWLASLVVAMAVLGALTTDMLVPGGILKDTGQPCRLRSHHRLFACRTMTTQSFPARRDDGSAEVAAVFRSSLDDARDAVGRAFSGWHEMLDENTIDITVDLAREPHVTASREGFRVVFEIRPGSRRWRDWAVALVSSIDEQLEADCFVGFFDGVTGRMHAASRLDLLDDGGPP